MSRDELSHVVLVRKFNGAQFDFEVVFLVANDLFVRSHLLRLVFERERVLHAQLGRSILVLPKQLLRFLFVHLNKGGKLPVVMVSR